MSVSAEADRQRPHPAGEVDLCAVVNKCRNDLSTVLHRSEYQWRVSSLRAGWPSSVQMCGLFEREASCSHLEMRTESIACISAPLSKRYGTSAGKPLIATVCRALKLCCGWDAEL